MSATWYRQGAINVNQGSTSVTGTGTGLDFLVNARVGDGFAGSDGRLYEVVNVVSKTQLTIYPAYLGTSVTGGAYAIIPVQGYTKESADKLREYISKINGEFPAEDITFDKTGTTLVSDNAQDALVELDTKKLGKTEQAADSARLGGKTLGTDIGQVHVVGNAAWVSGEIGTGTNSNGTANFGQLFSTVTDGATVGFEFTVGESAVPPQIFLEGDGAFYKNSRYHPFTFGMGLLLQTDPVRLEYMKFYGINSAEVWLKGKTIRVLFKNTTASRGYRLLLSLSVSAGGIPLSPTFLTNPDNSGFEQLQPFVVKHIVDTDSLQTFANKSFDTSILPSSDNTINLGSASRRFGTVYAGTGTINTSDAREKTIVQQFTQAEINASVAIAEEIGTFKFLDSIEQKGKDNARTHIGLTVQRAIEIMEQHGLDPFKYGFICYDEWEAEYETIPALIDEEENELEPEKQGAIIRQAGSRYGFRNDQLAFFIARGQAERQRRIEERLKDIEEAIAS
jgi:hypothetical protein